jgi:hypothetical protein
MTTPLAATCWPRLLSKSTSAELAPGCWCAIRANVPSRLAHTSLLRSQSCARTGPTSHVRMVELVEAERRAEEFGFRSADGTPSSRPSAKRDSRAPTRPVTEAHASAGWGQAVKTMVRQQLSRGTSTRVCLDPRSVTRFGSAIPTCTSRSSRTCGCMATRHCTAAARRCATEWAMTTNSPALPAPWIWSSPMWSWSIRYWV